MVWVMKTGGSIFGAVEGAAENTAPIKDFHLINRREFFAVYVGKNAEKESEVTLYDGNGKARIKMSVSADENRNWIFWMLPEKLFIVCK